MSETDRPEPSDSEPPRPRVAPGTLEAAAGPAPEDVAAPAVAPAADAQSTDGPPADAQPGTPSETPTADLAPAPAAGPAEESAPPQIDLADPDAEALAAIPLVRRIEALLFAATEPLPLKRLRDLTACPDGKAVRDAADALRAEYESAGRAFRVEEVAQGYQLRTTETVAPVVARLGRRPTEERLSTAALETLAVIAYRQPVLRVDVEKIRGVACGEVLRALQERGLVRIAGRAELPGSPLLYGTTQRFLEIFGLRDLQDLPRDRELLRPKE
jgi:segregation and condensation protein B